MGKIRDIDTYTVIGVGMEVHNVLGPGLLEKVYGEAFALELQRQDIPFVREKVYRVFYKGKELESHYIADFECLGRVIVELKAVAELHPVHRAQLINYMKISGLRKGVLLNFYGKSLDYETFLLDENGRWL